VELRLPRWTIEQDWDLPALHLQQAQAVVALYGARADSSGLAINAFPLVVESGPAVVSASEAHRSFSSLLRQVSQGKRFTVQCHGGPVATIAPVDADTSVRTACRQLLEQLSGADGVIPLPCLGELGRVLTAKAGRHVQRVQDAVLNWMDAFPVLESNAAAWRGAMELCVAAQAGARLLLMEHLHPGFSCWDASHRRLEPKAEAEVVEVEAEATVVRLRLRRCLPARFSAPAQGGSGRGIEQGAIAGRQCRAPVPHPEGCVPWAAGAADHRRICHNPL
jgi:antitoxin (DNA-binding transcriptional repressor) of toxin-antitoxin stability system